MAHTEDIPEKVADLLFDQTPRAAGAAANATDLTIQTINHKIEDFLAQLRNKRQEKEKLEQLSQLKGEVNVSSMNELLRNMGLKSHTMRLADSDAKDFEGFLKREELLFAKMSDKYDDATIYIFLDRDKKRVEAARTALFAYRGKVQELEPNLYFSDLTPDDVRVVKGLDAVELTLFRHYARHEGLLFTVVPQGDKNYVVYAQKDRAKANKALGYMSWDLTGANGARYRQQVEYHLEGHNKIRMCLEDAEREMYIVSRDNPGNFIRLTCADYTLYKGAQQVATYSRANTADFEERVMAACDGLRNPMVLDVDDFVPGMQFEDLMQFPTMELHTPDYDDEIEMNKVNSLANLIAMKQAIDNEGNTPWGVADSSISYSEFSGFEFIMDTDEREAREREFAHFLKADAYGTDRYEVEDIHMDQKSVDFLIAQAEMKRDAQAGIKHEQTPQREAAPQREAPQPQNTKDDDGILL